MANFNKVILLGNLTRDPQLRYTPSQQAVCDFSLAVNRKWKSQDGQDREEVTFVECTAWGRTAEVINQYCTKGRPLFVEGRLKLDQWDDKTTGAKRSKLSVVVETMQLLGGRDQGGGGGAPPQHDSQEGGEDSGAEAPPPRARPAQQASRPTPAPRGPAPARPAPQPDAQPPFSEEPQFKDDDIPF